MKKAFWEFWAQLGPMALLGFGFFAMGIGAIQWGEATSNLTYDNHLRTVGVTVTSKVVEIDKTGGGKSGYDYAPVTVQRVDGTNYRTVMSHYKLGDSDYYKVGQRLPVMYDPADPYDAGVKKDDLHDLFAHNIRIYSTWFWVGAAMFGVGIPFGLIQFVKYRRKQKATKEVRRWRKLRRKVKDRRRAARRKAYAAEKRVNEDRQTK